MTMAFVVVLRRRARCWRSMRGICRRSTAGCRPPTTLVVRGQTTVIAPQVSGYATKVYVQDFEHVAAGAPLVQIDDRIYRQRVEQARGQHCRRSSPASPTRSRASARARPR